MESNLDSRDFEPWRDHLIFAEDGTVCYTLNVQSIRYEVITSVGMSVLASYPSFDELLDDAFRAALGEH